VPEADVILARIAALEADKDPKCHATASRLEDFMFGTELEPAARFAEHRRQQAWALAAWRRAHEAAGAASVISAKHVNVGMDAVSARDRRQYSSVAYSLRALLAVQQEMAVGLRPPLKALDDGAVRALATALDTVSLLALQRADEFARARDRHTIDVGMVEEAWGPFGEIEAVRGQAKLDVSLLRAIVAGKVAAYAAYNEASSALFVRNLQVFFAKARWPSDARVARAFRQLFTESLIAFAGQLYAASEAEAAARGHRLVREEDVYAAGQRLAPFETNAFEDVVFFPRLARDRQVVVESYDLDAFRDSGIHWKYLSEAVGGEGFVPSMAPDPFAAELLAEQVSQLGLLLLRLCGEVSTRGLHKALAGIAARVAEKPAVAVASDGALSSAPGKTAGGAWFVDAGADLGFEYRHRSSDWLSRQLRSYLQSDGGGNITIPPAFGGAGVAVGDVNGDGWDDIVVLGGLGNRLFLNRAGKRLEDVTAAAGLSWSRPSDRRPGEPRQPLIADLDNDGDQDIIITYVGDPHRVYRNRGDATFDDVTDKAGLGGAGLVGGPATVFDYDGDGLLDVYIAYFGDYLSGVLPTLERRNTNGLPNRLFRNKGDLVFEDVTAASGTGDRGWGQAVTHTDLNGDGRQDLLVGNDFGVNAYYVNKGGGRFEEASAALGTDKPSYTMGFSIADLNADDRPDIYVSNIVVMNKDEKYVLPAADTTLKLDPAKMAAARVLEANDLFVSGDGRYTQSRAIGRGYASTGWSWGAAFVDFDLDGDDDLYVTNGMNEYQVYSRDNPYYTDPEANRRSNASFPDAGLDRNVFFANEGGRLENRSAQSGLDRLSNSRSVAVLDVDHDGDQDLVVLDYHGPAALYRNRAGKRNGYLAVRLVGGAGQNRDGIGARIVATLPDGRTVRREVRGSDGYMSVSSREQIIGLGAHPTADLTIIWPDGARTERKAVPARSRIEVRRLP